MNCLQCRADNQDDKKYCGSCGAPLSFNELLEAAVSKQLDVALAARFRDANSVQTEWVAKTVEKLSNWIKLLASFVGIPITVFLIVLGFLGFSSYREFKTAVDQKEKEFKTAVDQKENEFKGAADQKAADLENAVKDRESKLNELTAQTRALDGTFKSLSSRILYYESLGNRMEQLASRSEANASKLKQIADTQSTLQNQQQALTRQVNKLARDTSLDDLQPRVADLARKLVAAAREKGILLTIWETCRSEERQQEMFNQGLVKLKIGMHGLGLAFDVVKVVNGEPSGKGDFSEIGKIGGDLGLTWGGDWASQGKRTRSLILCTFSWER